MWEVIVEYLEGNVMEELVWGYIIGDCVFWYVMVKVVIVLEFMDIEVEN